MTKEFNLHIKKYLNLHKSQVEKLKNSIADKNILLSKKEFNHHQATFFDEQSECYKAERQLPIEVKTNLNRIIETAKKFTMKVKEKYLALDVGSGGGVLIPYIKRIFTNAEIHALDLSENQLKSLQKSYPDVIVHHNDIANFHTNDKYHLIICNACFGNFYSQHEALQNMDRLLNKYGLIVISHPVGAKFVEQLHLQDTNTVPHLLPTTSDEINNLCQNTELQIETLIHEDNFYLLTLKKTM